VTTVATPMDLTGELPSGTVVLQASAGTGKTYTIAGLVARYIAEGEATIEELLVVTFGRAATSELRSRVRERLQSVHAALVTGSATGDSVVAHLRGLDVALCTRRLAAALAAFDAATVSTTHEFCHQVLRGLGVLADHDRDAVLVDSLNDLVTEVADDLYLQYGLRRRPLPFDRSVAQAIAHAAVGDPEALLLPDDAPQDSESQLRVRFCRAVRNEVAVRKHRLKLLSFDDLLGKVRDALADEVSGEAACDWLRRRYKVVLVDEFQDTDPVQWEVLERAFHGSRTLVVIGDPKQAIYAFRGADVRAYLHARERAHDFRDLDTNWRSDPRVLDGLAALLRDAVLGEEGIAVTTVKPGHETSVVQPPAAVPVELRLLTRQRIQVTKGDRVQADAAVAAVAGDAANQVARLLSEHLVVHPREGETRDLEARDIAVLVRTGRQAEAIRAALLARDVPCVLTGTVSVFSSDAALDWRVLLEALEQPHRSGRVRRFALSAFVGATASDLDGPEGVTYADGLAQQLRDWAEVLADRGIAGLYATIAGTTGLVARLLEHPDGERIVTDLRHVAEILHRQGTSAELGLAGLVSWMRDRVEEATEDQDQERSRRLDTDRSAVQVMTVHASKGLEFPVVLVPFAWVGGGGDRERCLRGHAEGHRTLFVGGKQDSGYNTAVAAEAAEDAGEELRLLYVALTRAVSRLLVWWAPGYNTNHAPLHRLLFAPHPTGMPARVDVDGDDDALVKMQALAGQHVRVETVPPGLPVVPGPGREPQNPAHLHLPEFGRVLDTEWRRTSYSGLTRDLHETAPAVGSEPEAAVKDDEPAVVVDAEVSDAPLSPMSDLEGGAAFGTAVHAVLELADLAVTPIEDELRRAGASAELAAALVPALSTPLGPLGVSLREVPREDQLRELEFEIPLVGGDDPADLAVRLSDVADLLHAQLPPHDPVHRYADVLKNSAVARSVLRGFLGGSIDVVLRIDGRFWVADHKTNRLAPHDVPLTAHHYRQEALHDAMVEAHYPLQALLYAVALHRYLRWRLPGYDPAEHLGGVLYLFLRGMCGPGVEAGVWAWTPPATLVPALSDLLAGVR
jgi:exodeoxyribonuclease V beta subunit